MTKTPVTHIFSAALLAATIFPVTASAQILLEGSVDAQVDIRRGEAAKENQSERKIETSENKEERKEAILNLKNDIKTRLIDGKVEVKTRIAADAKEKVEGRLDRIFGILNSAFDRLGSFESKVETRINSLESEGKDVSESKMKLAAAADVRAEAASNVADLSLQLDAAVDSDTSREEILAIVQAAREEVKRVRNAYVDVLVSLRAEAGADAQ